MNLERKAMRFCTRIAKESRTDIIVLTCALAVSFLSLVFFSLSWHRAIIEGRSFPSLGGSITMLPLVESVPFAWPYLLAGILFRLRHSAGRAFRWALGSGIAGAVLHSLLVSSEFPPDAPALSYISFYSRFLSTPLFASLGFLIIHVTRTRNERLA